MSMVEGSKEKGCLACNNACFTLPQNPVSFPKTFWEKPLGESCSVMKSNLRTVSCLSLLAAPSP